jgi:hypothetical protein
LCPSFNLLEEHAIVFIDETGHDRFHDRTYPVFGWAGCAMTVATYRGVAEAWRELKRVHFPDVSVLHAADLRRPRGEQLSALATFFRSQPFARFAAVTRSDATIDFPVLNTVAVCILKRLETVLRHMKFERFALVFEAGETWEAKVERMFGSMRLYNEAREVPIDKLFMAKKQAEPGLEIADFIAHAVGGSARAKNVRRKDFRAVFDVSEHLTSFILIESATRVP